MTAIGQCRPFRPGADADVRAPLTASLWVQLNAEWARLCASAATRSMLQRWAGRHPDLVGAASLDELLAMVDAADEERTDAILLALVRLAQEGQYTAGRTLLQAMLPKLSRMVSRLWAPSLAGEDLPGTLVAALWEVIMSYPVARRPRKVAANLSLDTLHRVTAPRSGRGAAEVPMADDDLAGAIAGSTGQQWASIAAADAGSAEEALRVLVAAARDRVISTADASLLARVYVSGDRPAVIDSDLRLSPAARRQRCSRATRRLAEEFTQGRQQVS